jgi:hypothetical protein
MSVFHPLRTFGEHLTVPPGHSRRNIREMPGFLARRVLKITVALVAAAVTFWVMLRILVGGWIVFDADGPSRSPLLVFSVTLLLAGLAGKVVFHLLAERLKKIP